MKSSIKLTKAEKREEKHLKTKKAPKGGTLAGQIKKVQTSKKYAKKKLKT